MARLDSRVAPVRDVAHREIAEQTVAVNLQTGRYHALNDTGGRMLTELLAGPTVGDAVERLASVYAVQRDVLERDVLALCDALADRGLVTVE
ncbi:MAG: PqqD family protein [Solirubrobacteraceae bacterium]